MTATAAPPPKASTVPNPVLPPGASFEPPKPEAPRQNRKSLSDYFGQSDTTPTKTPPVTPETPKAQPAEPEAPKPPPASENPPAEPPDVEEQPSGTPPPDEPDKSAKDDIDSLLDEVKPRKQTQPAEPIPTAPKELRNAYERLKTDHEKTLAELKKFHVEQKESESLKEAYDKLAQEREELASRLAAADYTQSPDYHQKYVKPFEQTASAAIELAGKYNNELESRKGTDRDIYTLYTLYQQDPAAADARAQEMFGTAGITIMRKVEAMYDHNRAMTEAVADWRKGSATRAKEAQLAQEKQFSRVMEIWKDQIDREKSTRPDIYDFTSDPKLAGIFKRSEAFADAAFRPDPQMPLEDTVRHQAKVRSLAALAPALLGKVAKLEAELEAAKAALSEYEGGKPHVKPTGESQKPVEKKHGSAALGDYFKA